MAKAKIRAWRPSTKQEEAFQATDASFHWLCNLPADLLHRYSGKWIAVRDCRIIAGANSLDDLLEDLKDVDLATLIIDHVEQPTWAVYR